MFLYKTRTLIDCTKKQPVKIDWLFWIKRLRQCSGQALQFFPILDKGL